MGSVKDFPRDVYGDTLAQRTVITDVVSIVKPLETPLIAYLGGLESKPGASWKLEYSGTKVYWLERDLLGLDDTVPSGGWTNAATTLSVNDASLYHAGDVLKVDSEYIWVSSVNLGSNQITVTRGFAGTTAAAHSQGAAIAIIGNASTDNAESTPGAYLTTDREYNVTQIFMDEVSVNPSEEATDYLGDSGIELETRLTMQRLLLKVERALLWGKRNDAASVAAPRALGGIDYYINVAGGNVVSNVGVLSLSAFEDVMAMIYEDSASLPTTAMMSMRNAMRCLNMFENYVVQVPRTETTAGMTIKRIVTMYGELDILINRNFPDDKIYLINKEHVAIYPHVPFSWVPLARTGLPIRRMVFGELSLLVRHGAKAHGVLTGITA